MTETRTRRPRPRGSCSSWPVSYFQPEALEERTSNVFPSAVIGTLVAPGQEHACGRPGAEFTTCEVVLALAFTFSRAVGGGAAEQSPLKVDEDVQVVGTCANRVRARLHTPLWAALRARRRFASCVLSVETWMKAGGGVM